MTFKVVRNKRIKKISLPNIKEFLKMNLMNHYLSFYNYLTLSVQRTRKVDNAELPRPTAGEKSQQKNMNLFLRTFM